LRYSARRCELSLRAAELRSLGSAVTVRQWSRLQRINRAEAERSLNELEAEGFGRWTWHKPAGKGRPTFRFELLGRDTIPGGRDTNAGRCDTIPADADCSPDNSEQPADAPRPASAQTKRPPTGHEKWRDTQDRMLSLFRRGDLPSSIRKTHKLLKGSGYSVSLDTVRRASVKSSPLSDHFRLVRPEHSRTPGAESPAGSLLDELAGQADAQTRRFIDRLTDRQRQDANSVLAEMHPADRLDLIQALASNPDNVNALRNGVTLMDHDAAIEDDRGDWSE